MDRATRREQRIRHIEENVAKLRAEQNRLKALTSKEQRKIETRLNILAGLMIRARVKEGAWSEKRFLRAMDEFLERDRDREIYGLPPRSDSAAKTGG